MPDLTPSLPDRRPAGLSTLVASAVALCCSLFSAVSIADEPAIDSPFDTDMATAVVDVMTRVVGGNQSAPGQWPSIVALVDPIESGGFQIDSPADRQFCGATVIGDRWLVTAAHCLFDLFDRPTTPASIRVIEGVTNLRTDSVEELHVANIILHPDYRHGSENTHNDIALLEVATELESPAVPLFVGDPEQEIGRTGVVVGWGATEFASTQLVTYPDELHHAAVPLVSRATCNSPNSYNGLIFEGQLCAGFLDGGVDSCIGDSGGPLFVRIGESLQQIGVTSFGKGCAEPNFYGIYTSVSHYADWIRSYVGFGVTGGFAGGEVDPGSSEAPRSPNGGSAGSDSSGGGGGGAAFGWLLGVFVWLGRASLRARFSGLTSESRS